MGRTPYYFITVCGQSHVYLVLVYTTVVPVLFVATPTSTIESTTVVCLLFVANLASTISVYCLWPLPRLLLVCCTSVQVQYT